MPNNKPDSTAQTHMICGPPSKLLCQLLLTQVTSPLCLNTVRFSHFELTVGTGQTAGRTDSRDRQPDGRNAALSRDGRITAT